MIIETVCVPEANSTAFYVQVGKRIYFVRKHCLVRVELRHFVFSSPKILLATAVAQLLRAV